MLAPEAGDSLDIVMRSGGPASNVQWGDLGQQGRSFVATGPTAQEIGLHRRTRAGPDPRVRGASSADDPEVRAQPAVQVLTRDGPRGQDYAGQHAFGWAEVLQPDGWTADDGQRLSEVTTAE